MQVLVPMWQSPSWRGGGKMTRDVTNLRGAMRLPETEDGTIVYNTDPLIIKFHYEVDYIHSFGQDSPYFIGLSQGKLMGTRCTRCKYGFATPKTHCMECGAPCKWEEMPKEGKIHTWTVCNFGSQEFLDETPFTLILVEFKGFDTLLLSRLIGETDPKKIKIGDKVKAHFKRNSKFKATDVYFVKG